MLECQRAAFSLPESLHYLNCAYMAPLPNRVAEAGFAGIRNKLDPTGITPADFFTDSDRVRGLFGRLVNAPADRIAIIPAVSYGAALVAKNVECSRGMNVVVAHEQFPSNVYAWRGLCERTGAELRMVRPPADAGSRAEGWNERIFEAIDQATALVALPPLHWTDGTLFDLARIGARAREVGAIFVVDGTQAIGALPFDVREIQPDALLCAGYKWLLGPYSIGVAYLGPRFDRAVPLEETWIGRLGSEDFRGLVNYRDEYQSGAARFDVGERSNFILVPMLAAALELVLDWGVDRIQAYCRRLAEELIAGAEPLGFSVEAEPWRAGHLVGLRAPRELDERRVHALLRARNVAISLRGSALRVSPHVYNREADVDALLDVLRELA